VVGVLAAAYTDPLLEPISFDPLESLAATLALVIAARASTIAAIPVAAILLAHGLSPVVAFIGVVVGWLQAELMRTLGSRLWISTLGLAAGVLGYFASPLTLAVVLAPRALVVDADQSIHWAQWSALALVGAILLVQLWRDGLDGWLSQLSSARSARKRANPPAAAPAAQQR
jgi:predicted membrane protein